VLSREEVAKLISAMEGTTCLMAELMYGIGMRSQEVIRLRVHDIDFDNAQIYIRNSKGGKDRKTMLPSVLCERLKAHIANVRQNHNDDLEAGFGSVYLPPALSRKYPNAAMSFG
jgi:integrase